jgi:hypothetical protein
MALSDLNLTTEAKLVRTEKGNILRELCFCIALQQKYHRCLCHYHSNWRSKSFQDRLRYFDG